MVKDIRYLLEFIGNKIDHNRDSIINRVKQELHVSPQPIPQEVTASYGIDLNEDGSNNFINSTVNSTFNSRLMSVNQSSTGSTQETNSTIISEVDKMVSTYCDLAISDLRKVRTSYVNDIEDELTAVYGRNNFLANIRMVDEAGYYIQDKIYDISRQVECDLKNS